MSRISDAAFKPLIGWIVLALALMQAARLRWPNWMGAVPHTRPAVWVIGLIAGGATMLANAAGPVVALYCIAVGLPKFEVVGTLAWFFLIINVFKLPFSAGLGLIRADTLLVTVVLLPVVLAGVFSGRWIVHRLPQRVFDVLLIAFAVLAALRLILGLIRPAAARQELATGDQEERRLRGHSSALEPERSRGSPRLLPPVEVLDSERCLYPYSMPAATSS